MAIVSPHQNFHRCASQHQHADLSNFNFGNQHHHHHHHHNNSHHHHNFNHNLNQQQQHHHHQNSQSSSSNANQHLHRSHAQNANSNSNTFISNHNHQDDHDSIQTIINTNMAATKINNLNDRHATVESINNNHTSNSNKKRTKRIRTTFTPEQLRRLEEEFLVQMYLVGEYRQYLAKSLGLSEGQVKVWFQNRRIKQRKMIK